MAWFRDHSQGGKPQHVQGGISPSLVVHTCPGSGRHSLGEVRGQGQHRRYKSRLGGVGVGADSGLGERMRASQSREAGRAGGQPSLPTGFLGGGTQAGALPQRILVVGGAAPAPAVPAADTAHSRDAAAAVGHVASADRAGPEAIAAAAAGAADDGCGAGRAEGGAGSAPRRHSWAGPEEAAFPQDRCGSWNNGLAGGPSHGQLPPHWGQYRRGSSTHSLPLVCPV